MIDLFQQLCALQFPSVKLQLKLPALVGPCTLAGPFTRWHHLKIPTTIVDDSYYFQIVHEIFLAIITSQTVNFLESEANFPLYDISNDIIW